MIDIKKRVFKEAIREKQEKSEILSISNKYKNLLEDFVDSFNIKYFTILKQINLPNNNISGSKDNSCNLNIDNNLLDRS